MDSSLFDKYNITRKTMLEHAIKYAEMGFAVFPVEPQGKAPMTAHGVDDATNDIGIVTEMWAKYPFANIGMACGKVSGGILVVDVDIDDEKGKDGNASLKKWEQEHGELPETAMTLTGRGGNHYLYRYNGSTKNRVGCMPDIDTRGDKGYIVLPPSIHPNGIQYLWEYEIDDYGIADANQSVLDLMNNGVEVGQTFAMPERIPDGERNSTLYKLACSMQARGNSDTAIKAAVVAENQARCIPPLDDEEIELLIKSALTKEKGTAVKKDEAEPKKKFTSLKSYTFSEIAKMDLSPPEFLIEDILPKGVCILGAPPKMGKSWMALDMAIQIASGGIFLGKPCKQAEVLYLALEDSFPRLYSRANQLQGDSPIPEGVHIVLESEVVKPDSSEEGLYAALVEELDRFPSIELVIIDTLQMVTPSKQRGEDAYASTYKLLNSIRPLWQEQGTAFLLIHHTRKRSINDFDPFETFLGSQGLTGATDGMYIIQSNQSEDYCTFFGRGRDFEDVEFAIRRDEETCRWGCIGTPEDMKRTKLTKEYVHNPIVKHIKETMSGIDQMYFEITLKELREIIKTEYGDHVPGVQNAQKFRSELNRIQSPLLLNDDLKLEFLGNTTRGETQGTFIRITKI